MYARILDSCGAIREACRVIAVHATLWCCPEVLPGLVRWPERLVTHEAVCAARGPQELAESHMLCAMMLTMIDGAC